MRNNTKFLLLALLPLMIACGGQENQLDSDLAIPVSVIDVKISSIVQYINTTGTTRANNEITLNSEMTGDYFLLKNPKTGRKYKLGDVVSKGELIAKFEDREYVNNVSLEIKRLNLEISEQENKKHISLYDKGGVTLREMKNAEVALSQAKQEYENAKIQLEKMEVIAPFKSVVVDLPYYTNGTRLASNSPIATLMEYDKLLLEANLPEKYLSTIKTGQHVKITNYTLPDDTLTAELSELSPVVNSETRTFKGKIIIDNTGQKLRPGMFVKADIEVASKDSTIVIPKNIILSGNRGKTVYIVQKGAAQRRIITTGLENENEVEVIAGLKKNDRLIIKGFETIRDRSKVKVIQ
jgi:RND family efflux transporter MFP subunit